MINLLTDLFLSLNLKLLRVKIKLQKRGIIFSCSELAKNFTLNLIYQFCIIYSGRNTKSLQAFHLLWKTRNFLGQPEKSAY